MSQMTIAELEQKWHLGKNFLALLPLLEFTYDEAMSDLKSNDSFIIDKLDDFMIYALDSDSIHWTESAVSWIEQGYPMNDELCVMLFKISENNIYNQSSRHNAFNQARRWQHAKSI